MEIHVHQLRHEYACKHSYLKITLKSTESSGHHIISYGK